MDGSAISMGGAQASLETILGSYKIARAQERFGKAHPLWAEFTTATDALRTSGAANSFPYISFKWSAGQGSWARVPWIAALDSRETKGTSEGVYVIYLFRADMSGVYLALSQGTSWIMARYTEDGAAELKRRAQQLRERAGSLKSAGFDMANVVDLRSSAAIVRAYQAATVAFKFYQTAAVPPDSVLQADLRAALEACDRLIPTRTLFR